MIHKVYDAKPELKPTKPKLPEELSDSDIEKKLIERLANGEISSEVYSHAILQLKKRKKEDTNPMFH